MLGTTMPQMEAYSQQHQMSSKNQVVEILQPAIPIDSELRACYHPSIHTQI